jgi:ABC-type uncharacterized transport system ATPase subunit
VKPLRHVLVSRESSHEHRTIGSIKSAWRRRGRQQKCVKRVLRFGSQPDDAPIDVGVLASTRRDLQKFSISIAGLHCREVQSTSTFRVLRDWHPRGCTLVLPHELHFLKNLARRLSVSLDVVRCL